MSGTRRLREEVRRYLDEKKTANTVEIFDHLNTVHKNTWFEINGESNKWMVMIKMNGYLKDGRKWAPSKMTSTNGDVFSLVARVHK